MNLIYRLFHSRKNRRQWGRNKKLRKNCFYMIQKIFGKIKFFGSEETHFGQGKIILSRLFGRIILACFLIKRIQLSVKFNKILMYRPFIRPSSSSSSSFEGYPLQVRHKQDWGRGFILLLPQTAALPESDAGSDVIKPASSFVIQNRQTSCSMWCPMYRARC